MTGVRKFLIAYNVNLLSTKEQAHKIALNLREKGRGADQPGRLKAVQGLGWWLAERQLPSGVEEKLKLWNFHEMQN